MKIKKIFVVVLALMIFIALSILPASAAYYDNLDKDYKYFILFSNSDYILSTDPLSVYTASGYFYFDSPTYYKVYRDDKIIVSGSNDRFFYNVRSASEIESSNYDVYHSDGSLFFQRPTLLSQLLKLVPSRVGEKITADLSTLTICGVGCLSLLIGLALLPKVLYKFL